MFYVERLMCQTGVPSVCETYTTSFCCFCLAIFVSIFGERKSESQNERAGKNAFFSFCRKDDFLLLLLIVPHEICFQPFSLSFFLL